MQNVTRRLDKQRGFSLIELLVASSVGLIVLATVGSVFVSGQKFASDRAKQLMLAQDMNDAIRFIKTDVQRAGYNADNTGSLVLSGALSTISANAGSLSYVYEDENSKWRIVKFRQNPNNLQSLQMCVDTVSKGVPAMPIDASCSDSGVVEQLLDLSHINVTGFTVTPTVLATPSATSTLLTITLSASLKNSNYSKTVSTTIKARNWK
ncbi:prepilin-type N-terminal cleavage/methylation domain-containing protein [Photobacterium japonica]|uniref:prepilin-type N-terminal cleavage/methylation domain-containing protein n=1 Tax=Photobacterium japonica TaxID=2910235 RepID=UPI003D0AA0A1